MPLTSAALSVGQLSAIPYKLAAALRDVCVCGSVWGKFERGIKMPGAFGGTTEMTQVTTMKVRAKKNLTRIPYRHCRKHLQVKEGQQHSAGRERNSDQTGCLYADRRNTSGGLHTLDLRTIFILSGNYQLSRSVNRPHARWSNKR